MKKIFLVAISLNTFSGALLAQENLVSGVVISADDGLGVIGATITGITVAGDTLYWDTKQ